ncbi:hypothetical protein RM549_10115 [Salegentibacter sp. F188]|uniref:Secreted protein n=1 Tax=Autumnicola patrickiae TaxID=3075591 RepID=A0ABU3E2B7_9FLAO|nr:hypothetical protein [Salegentibacter sp. F188]MDT0690140.1 hypothetical protein [Salegentibacter sp. F188]
MKYLYTLFLIVGITVGAHAQIEIPRSTNTGTLLPAEPENNNSGTFSSFRLNKDEDKENDFLKEEPKKLDFRQTKNEFLTAGDAVEEKWKKDKEAKEEYRADQYMGDFTTKGAYVELYCRDHESVDGDRIRVWVNGVVVEPSILLDGGYRPILVTLDSGLNNIEFEALNQGHSGPNTAELRVFDAEGQPVTRNVWNLLTGAKASIIVLKQ